MIIKNKRQSVWVQLFGLFLSILPTLTYSAELKVELVVDNFPPYILQQNEGGTVLNIVSASFAAQGIKTDIEFMPWADVESNVDNQNRLSFMWSKTAKRKKKWRYSEAIYINKQILVSRKEKRVFWRRLDELRQFNIGVTTHHNYGKRFEDYRQYLNLTESISDFISLKKLINKKYDAVVLEELMARHLLSYFSNEKQDKIELLTHKTIDSSSSYLVCSKQNASCVSIIDMFNIGLQTIKANGEYEKIIAKGW